MGENRNILCRPCRKAMCEDCLNIADEYMELLGVRTQALATAERQREDAERERDRAVKRATEYARIMSLGQHALILAWMNDLSSAEILEKVERAVSSTS